MQFLIEHRTKILGAITTVLSSLMAMVAAGTFDGLLDPQAIRWLGILGALVGAGITGVGFSNTTKERTAAAMETAIKAVPPSSQLPEASTDA